MRLWVNKARTVLVSEHEDGNVTVALRDEEGAIWGPPILCVPERDEPQLDPADIRARRREAGLTQEQLANLARCSVASVAFLERGIVPKTSGVLYRISRALENRNYHRESRA
jgi:DNA-binding XRE family transcriptional regulator